MTKNQACFFLFVMTGIPWGAILMFISTEVGIIGLALQVTGLIWWYRKGRHYK